MEYKLYNWRNLKPILFNSICFLFLFSVQITAQNKSADLTSYIPYEETSLETHPIITIKVQLHIMKRYENDAWNMTEDSMAFIQKQMDWINSFYTKLQKPTIFPPDGKVHYIPDSRIRFRVDSVLFHTDSSGWDRGKLSIAHGGGAPWDIDTVVSETNEFGFKGNWRNRIQRKADSLKVVSSEGNNGVYNRVSVRYEHGITFVKVKEPIPTDIASGKISYFTIIGKNCDRDLWMKYTDSDKNYLHIFYTGSSTDPKQGGCGPSPYYLNVHNLIYGGQYAGAQLTAHEIGHCLGLSHTDRPQFDDLPATDKFGWIKCNNTNTSNNIMGYNICRKYLSPKQVGHIHKQYTTKPELIRVTTANEYDTSRTIEVWDYTTWNKGMLVGGDIIIRKRQTLEVNGLVSMPEGSAIYLEKRAKLIVNGITIKNYFDSPWQGVINCKSYERKHKVPKRTKNLGVVILNEGAEIIP